MSVEPSMLEPPIAATHLRYAVERTRFLVPRDPPALSRIGRERPAEQRPHKHPAAQRTDHPRPDRCHRDTHRARTRTSRIVLPFTSTCQPPSGEKCETFHQA